MLRMGIILTSAAVLALGQGASAQGQRPAGSNRVPRIMNTDMLQIQVPFLETITGPARRVSPRIGGPGQEREYRIDGCELTAITTGTQVNAYRLGLSPTCTFEMRRLIPNFRPAGSANQVTFAMLAQSFGTEFLPSCLMGCGNAADPAFSIFGESSRADGSIEVLATAIYNNDQVAAAAERLSGSARRVMSEDAIIDGRFNCHPRYQELAQQAFSNVRIRQITLGYGLSSEPPRC